MLLSQIIYIPKPWNSSVVYDWGINVEDASDRLPVAGTPEHRVRH